MRWTRVLLLIAFGFLVGVGVGDQGGRLNQVRVTAINGYQQHCHYRTALCDTLEHISLSR